MVARRGDLRLPVVASAAAASHDRLLAVGPVQHDPVSRGMHRYGKPSGERVLAGSGLDELQRLAPEPVVVTSPSILTHTKEPHLRSSNLNFFSPTIGVRFTNIVAGLFYIPTAWTFAELPMWARCLFAVLGVVIIALGVASIVCKGLTSEKLYKEIESMNRRASSLIAVKDGLDALSNRYLTYYDEQWNCWFLPNHRSFDSYEEDKRKLSSYLSSEFKIPSDDFQMRFVGTATSTKFSTAHNEERTYDYRLYLASVIRIPDAWDAEGEFAIGSKKCKWMTVDEMLNDRKIYAINHDVIQMLKDLI